MDKELMRDALAHIPVRNLPYNEWLAVGMAMKYEGFDCVEWDAWSGDDPRYREGECQYKWDGFHGSDNPVTGATIIKLAEDAGWSPPQGAEMDWDSVISSDGTDRGGNAPPSGTAGEDDGEWNPVDEAKRAVRTLFEPDERVRYVTTDVFQGGDGKWHPKTGHYDRTAKELLESLDRYPDDLGATFGDSEEEAGAWIAFNPVDGKGIKAENVTRFRYALLESDTMPKDEQIAAYKKHKFPVALLIDSGNKSIHAIVKVDAADAKQYRARVKKLYDYCRSNGLDIDTANKNPNRLARMPGVMRNGNHQRIVAANIGAKSWDEWVSYADSGEGSKDGEADDLPEIESLADYIGSPPPRPEPLIDRILRVGHKMIISGPSKAGKSFLLIELCIAIAEGLAWLGFQCRQGRVLYVNLEIDPVSCIHRFYEIYGALGVPPDNAGNIAIWNLRGKAAPMGELAPKLIERIRDMKIDAVILDPLYKVVTGDENSASDMTQLCNQFDRICSEIGCAVIYCHHYSKGAGGYRKMQDRASGSGVFARDPDAILGLDELARQNDQKKQQQQQAQQTQQPQQPVPDDATAWRLDASLREFPSIDPVDLWFRYPLHEVDTTGTLKNLGVASSPKGKMSKSTARDQRKAKFDKAFHFFDKHPPATVAGMASRMGVSEKTVRNRLKEYEDEYWCKNGNVGKYDKE